MFVYDGCYSRFRLRRHGNRVGATDRTRFVVCLQNHDQIGNRARGDRLSTILGPASQRLACALLLLSPCVPLLFMGEEYGEQRPFPFFCSFDDPLIVEAVRQGRRQEFASDFRWGADIPDPLDSRTFLAAKLAWAWPDGSAEAQLRQLYQDLLAARRRWPALRDRQHTVAQLVNDSLSDHPSLLVVRRGRDEAILAAANLTTQEVSIAALPLEGKDLLLSTEDARYGGIVFEVVLWISVLPHELLVFDDGGGSS